MAGETAAADEDRRSPEVVDRLFVGISGAIWLVLLAVGVIATIALVGLGRGNARDGAPHSPWVLYTIIAISSVTLIGAIPLLIRARRTAFATPLDRADTPDPSAAVAPAASAAPVDAPTEKLRVFGSVVDRPSARVRDPESPPPVSRVSTATVDRILLRCASGLWAAMGLALIGVATATYLLAVGSDTAAWIALGVAGAVTVGMPVIAVFFQREFDASQGESSASDKPAATPER